MGAKFFGMQGFSHFLPKDKHRKFSPERPRIDRNDSLYVKKNIGYLS
jgi:hypothetical protein